jgi:excisionase family DNA binding protein
MSPNVPCDSVRPILPRFVAPLVRTGTESCVIDDVHVQGHRCTPYVHEGKPPLVKTKEGMMSTTTGTNETGGILTIDQAAAYLSIPKATLYTWRTRRVGFGPRAVKVGGCLRYRRSDLDAWVAEHVESFDDAVIEDQRSGDGISLSRASRPR